MSHLLDEQLSHGTAGVQRIAPNNFTTRRRLLCVAGRAVFFWQTLCGFYGRLPHGAITEKLFYDVDVIRLENI